MLNISEYIIEKLQLTDKIKVSVSNYMPEEKDFETLKKMGVLQNSHHMYLRDKEEDVAKRFSSVSQLMRYYIAILIATGSTPFIGKDNKLYSFPGNYGRSLIEKASQSKKDEIHIEEVIDVFNDAVDEWKNKAKPDDYLKQLNQYVDTIVNMISKAATFEFKPFNEDNYSDIGKTFLNKINKANIVPITIKYNNHKVDCELCLSNYGSYYAFIIDGKNYGTSTPFIEKIRELLNI